MGNYVFDREGLNESLEEDDREDFGKHIIPGMKKQDKDIYAYIFPDYWADIGQIGDYFDFNMAYAAGNGPIDLEKNIIKTHLRHLPGALIEDSDVKYTQLSAGDKIRDSELMLVMAGYQVTVESGSEIDHTMLLGADRNTRFQKYSTRIKDSRLSYVIADKNVWIEDCDIGPHNGSPEERIEAFVKAGLQPYTVNDNGSITGDFHIDPGTGIITIRKQREPDSDKKMPLLYKIRA
jgi:ADP-glucose pyrophosphorylase